MPYIYYYTLNSGHTRPSPRSEVRIHLIARTAPLLAVGTHDLGEIHQDFTGWRLVVPETPAGWLATLYLRESPVLTIGVASTEADAAEIWPGLEALYLKITKDPAMRGADFAAPRKPRRLPWVSVVLVDPQSVPFQWATDFEWCLACSWLKSRA